MADNEYVVVCAIRETTARSLSGVAVSILLGPAGTELSGSGSAVLLPRPYQARGVTALPIDR